MEHAQHRVSGTLRLLQSFPGYLDNKLVAACSPLDGRHAPDIVLALVFQLLENLAELAGDLELVIGVNRILATLKSRSSAVTKCCTAYTCSLSSLATRHGPVQVLMSLRRLPCLDTPATRLLSPTVKCGGVLP